MIRKWISLLLVFLLLAAAGICGSAENTETDGDDSGQVPVDFPGEADGDDSVQVPVDVPEIGTDEMAEAGTQIRVLSPGDEGEDVLFLQMRLKSLRYYEGEANGKYGKETENAVRAVQEDNVNRGLEATGSADAATLVLLASAKYRGLRYGSEGEDVKELQTRLILLGYYTGKVSGNYLEGTRNGIREFQKNNDLEATGVADPLTQEMLFSSYAVGKHDVAEPTPTPYSDLSWYLVNDNESGAPMPPEPVLFTKELRKDSKGDDVKKLQERMQQLGYFDGPISGYYRELTIAAVKKIQTQNGMKATGRTDEVTWNLIFNDPGIVMPDQTPKPQPTPVPPTFAITVDVKNQIVSVYSRDEEGNYTVPVKQMLCSTGKKGTPSPVGDWVLNGRKARWCYFPKWGDYARYWTRINSKVAFHSPIYYATDVKAMKTASYKMLGQRASHGCIRLSVPDAKWIYDNVGAGTVVTIREDMPVDKELKEALKLPASPNATATPAPPEPEYSREGKPQLRGVLQNGSRGDEVYWVQRRLKELGYYETMCTGHFLNRTEAAVQNFQRDHGFYPSGTVNQQLVDAMAEAEKATPTPVQTPEPTPAP